MNKLKKIYKENLKFFRDIIELIQNFYHWIGFCLKDFILWLQIKLTFFNWHYVFLVIEDLQNVNGFFQRIRTRFFAIVCLKHEERVIYWQYLFFLLLFIIFLKSFMIFKAFCMYLLVLSKNEYYDFFFKIWNYFLIFPSYQWTSMIISLSLVYWLPIEYYNKRLGALTLANPITNFTFFVIVLNDFLINIFFGIYQYYFYNLNNYDWPLFTSPLIFFLQLLIIAFWKEYYNEFTFKIIQRKFDEDIVNYFFKTAYEQFPIYLIVNCSIYNIRWKDNPNLVVIYNLIFLYERIKLEWNQFWEKNYNLQWLEKIICKNYLQKILFLLFTLICLNYTTFFFYFFSLIILARLQLRLIRHYTRTRNLKIRKLIDWESFQPKKIIKKNSNFEFKFWREDPQELIKWTHITSKKEWKINFLELWKPQVFYYEFFEVLNKQADTIKYQEAYCKNMGYKQEIDFTIIEQNFKNKKLISGHGYLQVQQIYTTKFIFEPHFKLKVDLTCYAIIWINEQRYATVILPIGPWCIYRSINKNYYLHMYIYRLSNIFNKIYHILWKILLKMKI